MIDNISVGKQISLLRKKNGFTQEQLAEKLGLSSQAISKWENGHTLPETAILPNLAENFDCSIDDILRPFAKQDSEFRDFSSNIGMATSGLALELYQKMKNKFDFMIEYHNEYHVSGKVTVGSSAVFLNPNKNDFIIRMDIHDEIHKDSIVLTRVPLPNCARYMHIIKNMPEFIKQKFRYNDCTACQCMQCPYTMNYTFENIDYKQCHYITIELDSLENLKILWVLLCAEHEI